MVTNSRWDAWVEAALRRVKKHPWRWGAVFVAVGGFLFSSFADWLFNDWLSRNVWGPMGVFLKYLGARPVGVVGLFVLGAILLLFALSFVDSSPTAEWMIARFKGPKEEALAGLRKELAATRAEMSPLKWWNMYRIPIPSLAPLTSEIDKRDARTEVARFEGVLKELGKTIDRLVRELFDAYREGTAPNWRTTTSHFLWQELRDPNIQLLLLLRQPGEEDPRMVFRAFYESYRELRKWMGEFAEEIGRPLPTFVSYGDWWRADAEFFRKAANFPNTPALAELLRLVEDQKKDGFPWELPQPRLPGA